MGIKQYQLTLFLGRYKTRSAGVWMYSVELLKALCALTQEEKKVKDMIFPLQIVFAGSNEQFDELQKLKMKYAELPIDIVRLNDFENHRKIGVVSDFFKSFNNTKILHATSNILPLLGSAKKIVTIHDLFQAYPINKPSGFYEKMRATTYKFLFYLQSKRADMIVTDLPTVSDEIKRKYRRVDKVSTVLPGLKEVYINAKLPDEESRSSYLISFASPDPRKNIKRVIEAFVNEHFLEKITLKIVASSDELRSELEYLLQINNIANIEVLSQVPDIEMQELYTKSKGVIFPSLAEGFGFPIYEALSQGVPVVTTASLAIEQIRVEVRPFVIECDPYSVESIGNAMQRAVSSVQRIEKRKKVASYVRNALNFRNTAINFIDLYSTYL